MKKLVDAKPIASKLGVSVYQIYALARAGLIPCVRLGRSVRFDPEAVDEWAANGGTRQEGEPDAA